MVSSSVRAKVDIRSVWTSLRKGGRRVSYEPRAPRELALSSSRTVWEVSPLHEYNVTSMSCAMNVREKAFVAYAQFRLCEWVNSTWFWQSYATEKPACFFAAMCETWSDRESVFIAISFGDSAGTNFCCNVLIEKESFSEDEYGELRGISADNEAR